MRDTFKKSEIGDVILPFVVLRRIDCILEPVNEKVRVQYNALKDKIADDKLTLALIKAAGHKFFNTSKHTLHSLLDDPANISINFTNYMNGFNEEVRSIFENFQLDKVVARLNRNNLLFRMIQEICKRDFSLQAIDNHDMGYVFEELIRIAKEAKLRNSAPIKYHIEISAKYWESIFRAEGITDRRKQQERIVREKQSILDFLTGAENSGKAWFSTFYISPDGKEQHDVVINKIDDAKEGGDWETDIQEAINMICFTMRVHSNLVGSVPGKAQSNNSGSDKRELYTIAQALQKPYHDLLFTVHRIIIRFNAWENVTVDVPFIQLTTLDEHQDAKQVSIDKKQDDNGLDN